MKARHAAAAALALAGGYLTVLVGTRRWHQHWGATDSKLDFIHAITIHAPPNRSGHGWPRWATRAALAPTAMTCSAMTCSSEAPAVTSTGSTRTSTAGRRRHHAVLPRRPDDGGGRRPPTCAGALAGHRRRQGDRPSRAVGYSHVAWSWAFVLEQSMRLRPAAGPDGLRSAETCKKADPHSGGREILVGMGSPVRFRRGAPHIG
jgi:hypothetical protein